MNHYPSHRYHPELGSCIVENEDEEFSLGDGWYPSPADFGVETCPGRKPDQTIAENKAAFEQSKLEKPKKAGRPAKPKEGEKA